MGVSPEEVRRVAALARLELEPDEVDALAHDLSRILEHVGALEAGGARPATDGAGASAPSLDDDLPDGDPLARPPSSFAPAFEDGFFTVPRLASHAAEDPNVGDERTGNGGRVDESDDRAGGPEGGRS